MGTLDSGGNNITELDDSGCVQDDASPSTTMSPDSGRAGLLDLSDDVLLEVLKYCEPRDLKALGFSCPRLGTLIQDRTLWSVVEERSHPVSKARLCWYLHNVLDEGTKSLLLTGYARETARCLVHQTQPNNNKPLNLVVTTDMANSATQTDDEVPDNGQPSTSSARLHRPCTHCKPGRRSVSLPPPHPSVCQECLACPPMFTVNGVLMNKLSAQCTRLERLSLEYCNIDCNQTRLSQFPRSLKHLSLRGSKCFNLPVDKSFLFQVHEWLPHLEEVNLSDCSWVEGCVLLPLSKLPNLYKLIARDCRKLGEFIAYASLAARYGFRALKVLDVRGSPLRDSEVCAFSWCPSLEELYLAACRRVGEREGELSEHVHSKEEELEAWETKNPEYFNDEKLVEEELKKEVMTVVSPPYLAWANGATRNFVMERSGITNVLSITLNQNNDSNTINISAENLPQAVNQNGGQNQDGGGPSGTAQNGKNNKNDEASDDQNREQQKNGIDMTTQNKHENSNQDVAGPSNVQNGVGTQNRRVYFQSMGRKRAGDDSSSDEEDSVPKKASKVADAQQNTQRFVRFRRNQPPVVVNHNVEGGDLEVEIRNLQEPNGNMALNLVRNLDRLRQAPARLVNQPDQNDFPDAQSGSAENEPSPQNVEQDRAPDQINQDNVPRNEPAIPVLNENEPRLEVDPNERYHVLYVNVGRQMHAEYEVSLERERPVCRQILPLGLQMPQFVPRILPFSQQVPPIGQQTPPIGQQTPPIGQQIPPIGQQMPPIGHQIPPINLHMPLAGCPPNNDPNPWDNHRRQIRNIFREFQMVSMEAESFSYVTDNALQRFGTQEVGGVILQLRNATCDNGKPKISKLKVLVCTGYEYVTNASLVHLAVTAPDLRFVDMTGTNVTARGVENFKIMRPDCEVKFGGSKSGSDS